MVLVFYSVEMIVYFIFKNGTIFEYIFKKPFLRISFLFLFSIFLLNSCFFDNHIYEHQLTKVNGVYYLKEKPYSGIVLTIRDNGYYLSKKSSKKGILNGETFYYYENGNIERTLNYKNNSINGLSSVFFENENIYQTLNYQNDSLFGNFNEWLIDGNLFLRGKYFKNRPIENWYYFIEGDTILIEQYDSISDLKNLSTSQKFSIEKLKSNDSILINIFDSKNNTILSGYYVSKLKEGSFNFNHKKTNLNVDFRSNIREGKFFLKKDEKILMDGFFLNGKKNGTWKLLDNIRYETIRYKNDFIEN